MRTRVLVDWYLGLALGLLSLGVASGAHAAGGFVRVPEGRGQAPALEIQVGRYDGGTNGVLSVEVRNQTNASGVFSARGLYFVPAGNPNQAPQRLGAVGPFQVLGQKGWQGRDRVELAAGATMKLKLDVYCIDSHRRSPTSGDRFRVAKDRMPAALAQNIAAQSAQAARGVGGFAAPAAKAAVQSEVWKARDKKWLKLDGEGRQEADK